MNEIKKRQFESADISLTEAQVKDLLREYGVSTPVYALIKDEKEILNLKMRYPVVLKVCSSKILHKTEVGGVKVNIKNRSLLTKEFKEMKEKFPEEKFLIETMEKEGLEIIVGLINDQTFGLCLMLGLGGIFTEVLEDVVFRVIPITKTDAEEMLKELKAKKVLEGFRGININRESIIDLLLKVSKLGSDLEDEIDQLDLNPVIVRGDGLSVVDAKLIRKKGKKAIARPEQDLVEPETIRPMLYPRNVALIGASANPKKMSYFILKNLLAGGYAGTIYPINPTAEEILGLKVKKSVLEIEEELDLGIVAVPSETVPQVVEECGKKGVKGLLIITGGFSEISSEGKELEQRVGAILEKYKLRAI